MIKYLQEHGADLEAADKEGRTVGALLKLWQAEQEQPRPTMWVIKGRAD